MTALVNDGRSAVSHSFKINDQFSRQAEIFAAAPALHNEDALSLIVDAAQPAASDIVLDVACGPGSIVAAFAPHAVRVHGLDATEAMLTQARRLAAKKALSNTEFHCGDVYALPFPAETFDIVSCRFAIHHFESPPRAFAEMARVCRSGGRIVVCDAVASDDPIKAAAFNQMERHRDPSTVEFRTVDYLSSLFTSAGLPSPTRQFYWVQTERDQLIATSFPANDDRDLLRNIINTSADDDSLGMRSFHKNGTVMLSYPSVVLSSVHLRSAMP